MDGSSRAFGVGPEIELCGQKFRVHAMTIECYAEVEAYLRKQRGDPAAMLAGRAKEFAQLNMAPVYDHLRKVLKEKAERDNWPEQSYHHANALIDEAQRRYDTTLQYEELLSRAFDEARKWSVVTLWEIDEFLETTWQGAAMKVWFAIRDNDREKLTLDYVTKLYRNELMRRSREGGADAAVAFRQEIERAIEIAEGTDALGNSTGSPPTSTEPSAVEPDKATDGSSGTSSAE